MGPIPFERNPMERLEEGAGRCGALGGHGLGGVRHHGGKVVLGRLLASLLGRAGRAVRVSAWALTGRTHGLHLRVPAGL